MVLLSLESLGKGRDMTLAPGLVVYGLYGEFAAWEFENMERVTRVEGHKECFLFLSFFLFFFFFFFFL
jgi:hypothetical protein